MGYNSDMDKHEEAIDFYARQFHEGFKLREYYNRVAAKEAGMEKPNPGQFGEKSARELADKLIAWLAADCPIKEKEDE